MASNGQAEIETKDVLLTNKIDPNAIPRDQALLKLGAQPADGKASMISGGLGKTAAPKSNAGRHADENLEHGRQLNVASKANTASVVDDADPRFVSLDRQLSDFEKRLKQSAYTIGGLQKDIYRLHMDAGKAESGWLWDRWNAKPMREKIEVLKDLVRSQQELDHGMRERHANAKIFLEQAKEFEVQGRSLNQGGNNAIEAQNAFNKAELCRRQVAALIENRNYIAKDKFLESIKADQGINDEIMTLVQFNERVEIGGRVFVGVVVVAGATVATVSTGGAALAAGGGFWAAAGTGTLVGTATGTGIGAVASYGEATSHVVVGNKEIGEAFYDGTMQTAEHAKDSLFASAGAAIGVGIAGKLGQAFGVFGGSGASVAGGAAAGGASSLVNDVGQTGYRITAGKEERSWVKIGFDSGKNFVVGLVSGSIGAKSGILKEGKNLFTKVGITGVQVTAESAVGVTAEVVEAKVEGREFSTGQAMGMAGHALWTGLVGEAVAGAAGRAMPLGKASANPETELAARAKEIQLSEKAQEYFNKKAEKIAEHLENKLQQHQEKVIEAAQKGADETAAELAKQTREIGEKLALDHLNVEKVSHGKAKTVVSDLLDALGIPKETKTKIKEVLADIENKGIKGLVKELQSDGHPKGKATKAIAREIHAATKNGGADFSLSDIFEGRIVGKVTSKLHSMMEEPWCVRFRKILRGEMEGEDSLTLHQATKARAKRLGKHEDEVVEELTAASWRGAKRGIHEAVEEKLRKAIREAIDEHRARPRGLWNSWGDSGDEEKDAAKKKRSNGEPTASQIIVRTSREEALAHRRISDDSLYAGRPPRFHLLKQDPNTGHLVRHIYEMKAGIWELTSKEDLGLAVLVQSPNGNGLSSISSARGGETSFITVTTHTISAGQGAGAVETVSATRSAA